MSYSTDVGKPICSQANRIGVDILCEKERYLAISDEAVEFAVFGIHLLAMVVCIVVIVVLLAAFAACLVLPAL